VNRIDQLKKKLNARKGVAGYEKNCEMIEAEIARLTAPPPVQKTTRRKVSK